jgi:hypothetical protein
MEDMKPTRTEGRGMTRGIEALPAVGLHTRLTSEEFCHPMMPHHSKRCLHIALSETMKRLDLLLNCGF